MVTTSEVRPSTAPADFVVFARAGGETAEGPTEKLVFLPSRDEQSPALHAFADARFWVDIMMEHALFFTMLMPEETVRKSGARRNSSRNGSPTCSLASNLAAHLSKASSGPSRDWSPRK